VSRSGSGAGASGARAVAGDAADAGFCAAAARDATAVYHCMNPPYFAARWAELLPRLQANLVAAAARAGARLVVLDNVYALGRTGGEPMNESTPFSPCSRKGEVRARVARELEDARRRGDVRAVTGRASDFYGPGGTQTHFNERFWRRVLQGKTGQVLWSPDTSHTWHYVEDVAAGLATLGEAPDAALEPWYMLPCAPAEPSRRLVQRFEAALGRPIRLARPPKPVLEVMGLFSPLVRELLEMNYQWDEPFVVDDRRFRTRFGAAPTPPDEGAARTVAWAVEAFGSARGAA
jgi:nucleoside-diphosphate-sugar epimerase